MSRDQPSEDEKVNTPKVKATTTITTARVFATTAFVLIGTAGTYLLTAKQQTNEATFSQGRRNLILKAQPQPTRFFRNPLKYFASNDETTLGCPQRSALQSSGNNYQGSWVVKGADPGCHPEARLGYSVSLGAPSNGDPILLTGAPTDNNKDGLETGPGYVQAIRAKNGHVEIIAHLEGDNDGDAFGTSVAISRSAYSGIAGAPNADRWRGYVKLLGDYCGKFTKKIRGCAENTQFGYSVSADDEGDTFVVGAPALVVDDDTKGQVYVYDNNGNGKGDHRNLKSPSRNSDPDGYGMSVSVSGNGKFIAVGAPLGNFVQVYKLKNNVWEKFGEQLDGKQFAYCGDEVNNNNDPDFSVKRFGHSLAMRVSDNNEKFLAVGVPNHIGRDCAYVFEWISKKWQQRGETIMGDHYDFGASIDLTSDGNWVIVGDPEYLEDGQQARGRSAVYKLSKQKWNHQVGDLVGAGSFDNAGYSSAITKDKCGDINVAVGSPMAEPNGFQSGMAAIIQLNQ